MSDRGFAWNLWLLSLVRFANYVSDLFTIYAKKLIDLGLCDLASDVELVLVEAAAFMVPLLYGKIDGSLLVELEKKKELLEEYCRERKVDEFFNVLKDENLIKLILGPFKIRDKTGKTFSLGELITFHVGDEEENEENKEEGEEKEEKPKKSTRDLTYLIYLKYLKKIEEEGNDPQELVYEYIDELYRECINVLDNISKMFNIDLSDRYEELRETIETLKTRVKDLKITRENYEIILLALKHLASMVILKTIGETIPISIKFI